MTITASPVPILKDNYAWLLRDSGTGATAIVDPAEAEPVIEALEKAGGRLDMILITHHHSDHTAAVDAVRARFHCPVYGAAADQYRLPALDEALKEGDTIRLGDGVGQVIDTPGHTRGQINFFFPAGPILLSGDTLFSLGCGRLSEGTPAEMYDSLRKLAALPADTLVCCGHEYTESNARFALAVDPDNTALHAFVAKVEQLRSAGQPSVPSLLGEELKANPFLLAKNEASFASLRAKKDRF
jgi:hydroxyacylglutathione hydrolase